MIRSAGILVTLAVTALLFTSAKAEDPLCKYCVDVVNTAGNELFKDGKIVEITKKFFNETCHKQKAPLGIDCKNVNKNVDQYVRSVLSGNHTGGIVCQALGACKSTTVEAIFNNNFYAAAMTFLAVSKEKECNLCTKIIDDVIEVYIKPLDERSFSNEMVKMCLNIAPFSVATCQKLSERFSPLTYQFLKANKDGSHACAKLAFCKKDDLELELLQSPPTTYQCNKCFTLTQAYFDNIKAKYSKEGFIQMLNNVCHSMTEQRQHCSSLVSAYAHQTYKNLGTDRISRRVCGAVGECARFSQPTIFTMNCVSCKEFVKEKMNTFNTFTDNTMMQMAERICWRLRMDDGERPHCVDLLQEYAPRVQTHTKTDEFQNNVAERICETANFCQQDSKPEITFVQADNDGQNCQICHAVQKVMKKVNTTGITIGYLEKICNHLPLMKQSCLNWVEGNRNEITANVTSTLDLDKLCDKACNPKTVFTNALNAFAQSFSLSKDDYNDDDEEYPSGKSKDSNDSSGDQCSVCRDAQEYLKKSNVTEAAINYLEKLCKQLPLGREACINFVNEKRASFEEKMKKALNSNKMCHDYCGTSNAIFISLSRTPVSQDEQSEYIIDYNVHAGESINCTMCRDAQEFLKKSDLANKAMDYLEKLCNQLPTSRKQPCHEWISRNRDSFQKKLEKALNTEALCKDICPTYNNAFFEAVEVAPQVYFQSDLKASSENYNCTMCKKAQDYLRNSTAAKSAIDYLKKLCDQLPALKDSCNKWLDDSREALNDNVKNAINSDEVCKDACKATFTLLNGMPEEAPKPGSSIQMVQYLKMTGNSFNYVLHSSRQRRENP